MAKKELAKVEDKATALAVIGGESFMSLTKNPAEIAEIMALNIGEGEMDTFSLDRVKMPAGGGTSYVLPTLEGDKTVSEIVGVIIAYQPVRCYWDTPYTGATNPPTCASSDGKTDDGKPENKPGGVCRECPKAAFGSKLDAAGVKGPGQACNECMRLFVLLPDSFLPILITLPPTSLKPARRYFQRLAGRGIPFYGVATQISLTVAKSSGGIDYSQAVLGMAEMLSDEQRAAFQALHATFAPQLSMIEPERGDYEEAPAGGEQSAAEAADAYEADVTQQPRTQPADAIDAAKNRPADQDKDNPAVMETESNASNE
jgi:hypothetical protein